MSTGNSVVLRFTQAAEQSIDNIKRVVGFVKVRDLAPLFSEVELESNPRSSKVGSITRDIGGSIEQTPSIFPFKTKGLLVGVCDYRALERRRYELKISEPEIEGILDGGHNALAIGIQILEAAGVEESDLKGIKRWEDFKSTWFENAELVDAARKDLDLAPMDVQVPVELLVPADTGDELAVDELRSSLLEICAARNNNAQLKAETKANQEGYFDTLKELIPEEIANEIEWKTNDGGRVKVADVLALSWIPLSLLKLPKDDSGRQVEKPLAQNIYRSKGECVHRYERLMSSNKVTAPVDGRGPRRILISNDVKSALELVPDLLQLHDLIYAKLPEAYNHAGGSFGRITAVKAKNKSDSPKTTKFTREPVEKAIPDGFVIPLVYGLQALIRVDESTGELRWMVDPFSFVEDHLDEVVAKHYKGIIDALDWDPQKVGKSPVAYETAATGFKLVELLARM